MLFVIGSEFAHWKKKRSSIKDALYSDYTLHSPMTLIKNIIHGKYKEL